MAALFINVLFSAETRHCYEHFRRGGFEATETMKNGRTRKPSAFNRELGLLSNLLLAIKYGVTYSNPCREIPWLP